MNYASKKSASRQMTILGLDPEAHEIRKVAIEGKTRFEIFSLMAEQVVGAEPDMTADNDETPPAPPAPVAETPVETPVVVAAPAAEAISFEIPDDVSPDQPVAFVWAFLAANKGIERRKQVKFMVEEMGVARTTAQTQTHHFYKAGGDKRKWLLDEATKRSAERERIQAIAKQRLAERNAETESAPGVSMPESDLEAAARNAIQD